MRLGVISRLSLTRKGLCALLASSKNCSVVLDLPSVPEDIDVLRKAQAEVLLYHANGGSSDIEAISRLRNLAPEIRVLLFLDAADEELEFQTIRAGKRVRLQHLRPGDVTQGDWRCRAGRTLGKPAKGVAAYRPAGSGAAPRWTDIKRAHAPGMESLGLACQRFPQQGHR